MTIQSLAGQVSMKKHSETDSEVSTVGYMPIILAPAHDVCLPITLPILQQIIHSFQHIVTSAYQSKLLSAICSLAFFNFLRIGEIAVRGDDHSNVINATQLQRLIDRQQEDKALELNILKCKHNKSGLPFVIYIYRENTCCPITCILDFISARGRQSGP